MKPFRPSKTSLAFGAGFVAGGLALFCTFLIIAELQKPSPEELDALLNDVAFQRVALSPTVLEPLPSCEAGQARTAYFETCIRQLSASNSGPCDVIAPPADISVPQTLAEAHASLAQAEAQQRAACSRPKEQAKSN